MKSAEQGTIHERIDQMIYHFSKGNRTSFGRETDILPGVLASIVSGRLSKPSFEVLQKILLGYPTVSAEWLLMGQGPMLKQEGGERSATGETGGQQEREAKLIKAVALLAAESPASEANTIMGELLPFYDLWEQQRGRL